MLVRERIFARAVRQHHRKNPITGYKKNRLPWNDSMNLVTICNIWLKCYLNFYKIVPVKMGGLYQLAIALNNFYGVLIVEKIIKSNGYCSTFSTLISVLPSAYSTIQLTLSPISAPRNFITSFGIVVLADKLFGRATDILDSYSNTFISPIFVYHYIYIYTQVIYNSFHKIGRNIYI